MKRCKNLSRVPIFLTIATALWGCVTSPVSTGKAEPGRLNCATPAPDREILIGLSVSGGGSRAALFAAGAIEALASMGVGPKRRSVLEEVSYISSVSGGSLASAYYVLKKPTREVPMLAPDGKLTEGYREFFKSFKDAMARDYEGPLFWRQMFRLRWFNPAWTARSLSEILDEDYLGGTTFDGLARREKAGDSPRFLINTTLYNDGRRFVLSTLNRESLRYDFLNELRRRPGWEEASPESKQILRTRWEALQSQTPQDLKLDVCGIKVASAVAASMSFPPIIGPISFRVEGEDDYWHVGDGGLSDNTGGESLLMVLLKKLQDGTAKRAVIIALDSSFPFDVGGKVLNHRHEGFSLFSYDFSRIPSIMEERSLAYRAMFFRVAQQQGLLPGSLGLVLIGLRHTDAKWKEDLSDLPDSCRKEGVKWKSPRDVSEHLAGIVTRLWIESACDRDLVLTAAHKLVSQHEAEIRKAMEP